VPESLLEELEKKAKPSRIMRGSRRPNAFMKEDEGGCSLYCMPAGSRSARKAAGSFVGDHAELIARIKERKPEEIPIIANVGGLGFFPDSFVSGAKAHERAGVDLIELNFSSPASVQAALCESLDGYFENNFPLRPPGLYLGDQPELAERVVQEVVKAVHIPVGVKISQETGFPRVIDLGRRIRHAGASFINCGNFALSVAAPDIYNHGKSKVPRLDGNPFMAVGGDLIRATTYKQIAAVAKFVPGIDIIACGGIGTPEQMVEAMMLGARVVEFVTPLLYQGRKLIRSDVRFLQNYMEEQGYSSVSDFVGLALEYIKGIDELDSAYDEKVLFAEVDAAKCKGCGICADSICLAMMKENHLARVNTECCTGCGLCAAICPHDAIRILEK